MSGLARLLAKLYSEQDKIHFFLKHSQTDIDPFAIKFDGSVNIIWERVLEEADKRKCLDLLASKAMDEFQLRRQEMKVELERYHQACDQPVATGPHVSDAALVVCADGGQKLPPEMVKALSILVVCPTGLPLEVLAQAVSRLPDELRRIFSEHADLVLGEDDLWSMKDRGQTTANVSPDLCAEALDSLLIFIRNHKKEPIVRSQADNAIELGKQCADHRPRTVARLFDAVQTILKRRGNKRLVLEVARLSLAAARCHPRDDKETEMEALTWICGEAWVFQRIGRLGDARVAAEGSLALGRSISYDRNTAFCMKCLGRLLRMEAEQERDRAKKSKLLDESKSRIEEAICTFATVKGIGPNHQENGDCYSLLARTLLVAGNRPEAAKAAKKAKTFLTDENDKDYLDWCLLMGDLEAAAQKYDDAEGYYEEVLRKHQADDAEKSEIVARAYLARAQVRLKRSRKRHAVADFEKAAMIWGRLGDIQAKGKAEWEKIKTTDELKASTIAELEKEKHPVRVEAYRLHRLSDHASSGKTLARRSERGKTAWSQFIEEARKNVAIQEEYW